MSGPTYGQLNSIRPTDNVIAVLGATGVGKSTLVSLITGSDSSIVGHTLYSYTERVQAIRCSRNGHDYVFLDTPGFDDTKVSDVQVLAEISSWLVSTYKNGIRLAGLLYLQRITDTRYTNTSQRNTELFKMLCGPEALNNVILVTTMWDEVDEEIGTAREEELRTVFWKSMLESGSRMERFKHTPESAWEIVGRLNGLQRRSLKLQIEMADQGKDLSQTDVGRTLFSFLTKMIAELQAILKKLKDLLGSAKSREAREELENQMSATEGRFRRVEEQRQLIGLRKRSFADVVKGAGSIRRSSSLIATPSRSFTENPLFRTRSFSSSISDVLLPSPASSTGAADEWLTALKTSLGLITSAAEIPPVPFLKGVSSLSLRIVEMVEATRRTDRSLVSLKNHAREFSTMIESHMTVPHLSPSVRDALEGLVNDLLAVQSVLKRMSKNGLVHRYALQASDQQSLNNCVSRLQEAHMVFLTKCILSIASDVGAIRANQEATQPTLNSIPNPPTIIRDQLTTSPQILDASPPPLRPNPPSPKPQSRFTM